MTDEPQAYTYDVFISYSHEDATWVQETLLPGLEAAGLRVCIDYRDFVVGALSQVNMRRAVRLSRHTLTVLTPAWVESAWTTFEAALAILADPAARQRKLIPVRLIACSPPAEIMLRTAVDFTRADGYEDALRQLLTALGVSEGAVPPSPPSMASPSVSPAVSQPKQIVLCRAGGDGRFMLERGLEELGKCLRRAGAPERLEFQGYERRLLEIRRQEQLYGGTPSLTNERNRIASSVDELSVRVLGESLNDFARGRVTLADDETAT